jgi:hypothetical protein
MGQKPHRGHNIFHNLSPTATRLTAKKMFIAVDPVPNILGSLFNRFNPTLSRLLSHCKQNAVISVAGHLSPKPAGQHWRLSTELTRKYLIPMAICQASGPEDLVLCRKSLVNSLDISTTKD